MTCPRCKKDCKKLTLDHRVPKWIVIHLEDVGVRDLENTYQYICNKCNSEKGGKIEYDDYAVRGFMKSYAEAIISKCNYYES